MTTPAAGTAPDLASLMMDELGKTGPTDLPEEPDDEIPGGDGDSGADADGAGTDTGADGGDEGDGGAEGAGADAAGGAGGAEGAPGEAGAEGGAADARPRNADGTFKSKEQLAAEAAAAPQLGADGKPVVKPAAKTGDPINDPIPQGLKKETTERMTKLVATAKDLTTKLDTVTNDHNLLLQTVANTGMNGQEFGEFLDVVGDARSDDPARQKGAYEYLVKVVNGLATQLGVTPPGVDPLEGHDDLRARVTAGSITLKDAAELAGSRRAAAAATTRQTQQQQRQQQQVQQTEQQQAARQQELGSLREQETTLKQIDPQFDAKKAILMGNPAFIQALKSSAPGKLLATFNQHYKAVVVPKPANTTPAAARGGQPLRGNKGPSGGAPVKVAKSVDEAIGAIDFSKIK